MSPTKALNNSKNKNTLINAVRRAKDIALVYPLSKSLFTPNKYRLNPSMTRNLTKESLLKSTLRNLLLAIPSRRDKLFTQRSMNMLPCLNQVMCHH